MKEAETVDDPGVRSPRGKPLDLRAAFRDADARHPMRDRTAWQVWQEAVAWALSTEQDHQGKDQASELCGVLAAAREAGWAFQKGADGITRMAPLIHGGDPDCLIKKESEPVGDDPTRAKRYRRALERILEWGNPFVEADLWAHNRKAVVAEALYGGFWEAMQVARGQKKKKTGALASLPQAKPGSHPAPSNNS